MPRQPKPYQLGEHALRPSMNAARLNPGVASQLGSANRAVGAAIGDLIGAFGQVAARAGKSSAKQNEALFDLEFNEGLNNIKNNADKNADTEGSTYQAVPGQIGELYKGLSEKYPAANRQAAVRRDIRHQPRILRFGNWAGGKYQGAQLNKHLGKENSSLQTSLQSIRNDPSDDNFMTITTDLTRLVDSSEGTLRSPQDAAQRRQEIWSAVAKERLLTLQRTDPTAAAKFEKTIIAFNKTRLKGGSGSTNVEPRTGASLVYKGGKGVPTAAQRRSIWRKGGVVVNLDTNKARGTSTTTPLIVIPDNATKAQRAAAKAYVQGFAKLIKDRFGRTVKARVVTRSQNGRGRAFTMHTEPYAVTDTQMVKFMQTPEGQAAHAKILRETLGTIPGVQFSLPHGGASGRDKGASHAGVSEVSLAQGLLPYLRSGQPSAPASSSDDQHELNIVTGTENFVPDLEQVIGPSDYKALKRQLTDNADAKLRDVLDQEDLNRLNNIFPGDGDVGGLSVKAAFEAYEALGHSLPGNKPTLRNSDGSISTEETITVEIDGKWLNIPTIVNGKRVDDDEAVKLHRQGKNKAVGEFATLAAAEAAARQRSDMLGRGPADRNVQRTGEQDGLITVEGDKGSYSFLPEHLEHLGKNFWNSYNRRSREGVTVMRRQQEALAERMMKEQIATVRQTGESHSDYDPAILQRVFAGKPKKLQEFNAKVEIAKREFEVRHQMHDVDSAALDKRLRDLEAEIVDDKGNANPEAEKAYNRVKADVERLQKLRQADPAKAVLKSHEVTEYLKTLNGNSPRTATEHYGLVDAILRAQARLGLEPTPLTKLQAQKLLGPLARASERDRRRLVGELVDKVRKIYGNHATLVLESAFALSTAEDETDRHLIRGQLRRLPPAAPPTGPNIFDQFDQTIHP